MTWDPQSSIDVPARDGMGDSLMVAVPTYNEAGNIVPMITALLALPIVNEVLVVDDHSPDGTVAVARAAFPDEPRLRLVERDGEPGRGAASRFAYEEFRRSQHAWLCEIDADFQEDPADIARLLTRAREARWDLAVGSRFVPGGSFVSGKRWLSMCAAFGLQCMFRSRIRDLSCSFHLMHRQLFEVVLPADLRSDSFFLFAELHLRAEKAKMRVGEVGCHFPAREEGDSKIVPMQVFRYGCEAFKFLMSPKRSRPPASSPAANPSAPQRPSPSLRR